MRGMALQDKKISCLRAEAGAGLFWGEPSERYSKKAGAWVVDGED